MAAKKQSAALLVSDLVGALSKKAPFDLAEDWDNVGLLAGNPSARVTGVVVAINLGPESLEKAKAQKANVIVCHHPPIFKAVLKLTKASAPYVFEAIQNDIAVIALHTNYDLASQQTSRKIGEALGFSFEGFLSSRSGAHFPKSQKLGKFVTYVPQDHFEAVRKAVCKVGAGSIGNYSDCSFSWDGEGTFQPLPGANPTIGKVGKLERVAERRLEVVFPWPLYSKVLQAAKAAHPYEAMAFDMIELAQTASDRGYGFVGTSKSSLIFHKLVDGAKQTFALRSLTIVGPGLENPKMEVRKIAFSPGSGSAFIASAAAKGCDAYVCGEVGYHQMLEARQRNLTLVLLGHSYSERFFMETVSGWCKEALSSTEAERSIETVFEVIHQTL